MKTISRIEEIKNKAVTLEEVGINRTFYWAYIKTQETINETVNFSDVIWENDVKEIISHCKEFNLDYITISNRQSGIEDILTLFESDGCQIELTKVRTSFIDYKTNEPEKRNAFKVIIKK